MNPNTPGCRRGTQNILTGEKRSPTDRRKRSSISVRSLLFAGRRETIRRYEDRHKFFYVDRYSQSHFGVIVLILLLSVADALLTIVLTAYGAFEVNPVMAYYLKVGPYTFLIVKYVLTSIGLITLLMVRNVFIKPIRMYSGSILYFLPVVFISVIAWQIFLIYRIIG
jgi:hypothetical protein